MLALIQGVLEGGRAQNFPLTRLVAHMEWALEDRPGVNAPVSRPCHMNIRSRQVWRECRR
jgi:hypothetical protein